MFLDPYLVRRVEIVLSEKESFVQRQRNTREGQLIQTNFEMPNQSLGAQTFLLNPKPDGRHTTKFENPKQEFRYTKKF